VLATNFLRNETYGDVLFFLDSDIIFNPDDLIRCVQYVADGTYDTMCGMYAVRDTANPHPALRLLPGQKIHMSQATGPVEIQYPATGFLAIHRRVLEAMAKTMEPAFSGPRWFYPMFTPFTMAEPRTGNQEYLSEDYAWSHRARELGFKMWLDPSIRLGHQGLRTYVLTDIQFDAGKQVTEFSLDEGGPDRTNVLGDLADYLGKTRGEIWLAISKTNFREHLAREWASAAPKTASDVAKFYRETPYYAVESAKFNTMRGYWARVYPALHVAGNVVDFGGGIGTLALYLSEHGCQVTYVDLPGSEHRKFAEWRFLRRGGKVAVRSALDEIAQDSQDAVVATDVIEHIHPERLEHVLGHIHRVLRVGGVFVPVNDFSDNEGKTPMHYETTELFNATMAKLGFELRKTLYIKR